MDCPECGTPLVTYRLADREAPVCEACGHVGIEAEHRPARVRIESWADALGRFYGAEAAETDPTVPVRATDWENPSPRTRAETWTEALERFYGGGQTGKTGDEADVAASEAQGADESREPSEASGEKTPAPVPFEGTPAVRRAEPE